MKYAMLYFGRKTKGGSEKLFKRVKSAINRGFLSNVVNSFAERARRINYTGGLKDHSPIRLQIFLTM